MSESKLERGFDVNERYSEKTDLEHVLLRPDTYAGGIEKIETEEWVYDPSQELIVRREVSYTPALMKIFDEILVNARDHCVRDESCNRIKVSYDRDSGAITVENNGAGIPVEMHEAGCYVPELVFARFRAGQNFKDDEQKIVGGRNGLGAKITNAFSKRFEIDTIDAITKQRYVQVFEENLSIRHDPEIKRCTRVPYTKITFVPDYERLGGMDGLEEDFCRLIDRRVYDIAACTRPEVLIYLNGEKLKVRTFEKYMNAYLGASKTAVPRVFTTLPNEEENAAGDMTWELGVALSDDGFQSVSFVNGIATTDGGTHVSYLRDQLVRKIGKLIRRKGNSSVKPAYIRENLWLFVNAVVVNPGFSSQTKSSLTTKQANFGFKHTISNKFVETLEKRLKVSKRAIGAAELRKNSEAASATDGKKVSKVKVPKLEDARWAGTKKSGECTLILTEGDSAKTMAMDGLQKVGRERYGVFPLRGKLLNVRNATAAKAAGNEEHVALKKILGLKEGVKYTSVEPLRYGRVMIMTDQDLDGSHIKGLFMNWIMSQWPELAAIPGFIQCFATPIVKVQAGGSKKRSKKKRKLEDDIIFFNMSDFEQFRQENPEKLRGKQVRYLKGLGSSEPWEARQYFSHLDRFVKVYEPQDFEACQENFKHAFDDSFADWRKKWLAEYDEEDVYDYNESTFPMDEFCNKELKHFSIYDNKRSLGHVVDGKKPSQRKVLWAMRRMNLWNSEKKVLGLAGDVGSASSYHHGETSLMGTMIGMAQNFAGANNVNLLYPSGQFGSRLRNGKDASDPRYIHTRLNHITKYIFRQEDDPVLLYQQDDEGKQIEPRFFVPIISMVLVNGCHGIGTGYMTDVPQFHPIEVLDLHMAKLEGENIEDRNPKPWYSKYRGRIEPHPKDKNAFVSRGLWERTGDKTIRITELPIGQAFDSYKEFLESHLLENAPTTTLKSGKRKAIDKGRYFLKDYESNTFPSRCDFTVTFPDKASLDTLMVNEQTLEKKLKLRKKLNLNNMNLFLADGSTRRFQSVQDIIHYHHDIRIEFYEKRRRYQLDQLDRKIEELDRKQRFMTMVLKGELETRNRPKAEIAQALREADLVDPEDEVDEEDGEAVLTKSMKALLKISLYDMTEEEVQKFLQKISELKKEFEWLSKSTPQSLWKGELLELRRELELFLKDAEEEDDDIDDEPKKKPRKKTTKRKRTK